MDSFLTIWNVGMNYVLDCTVLAGMTVYGWIFIVGIAAGGSGEGILHAIHITSRS